MLVTLVVLLVLFVYFYKKFKRRKVTLNGHNQQNRSNLSNSSSSTFSNQYEYYTNLNSHDDILNKKQHKSKKPKSDKEFSNLDKSCQVMQSQFECANVRKNFEIVW